MRNEPLHLNGHPLSSVENVRFVDELIGCNASWCAFGKSGNSVMIAESPQSHVTPSPSSSCDCSSPPSYTHHWPISTLVSCIFTFHLIVPTYGITVHLHMHQPWTILLKTSPASYTSCARAHLRNRYVTNDHDGIILIYIFLCTD